MVMHANSLFWRLTKTESLAAIATLVVDRYPEYAPAHSMLAFSLLLARHFGSGFGFHARRFRLLRLMSLDARQQLFFQQSPELLEPLDVLVKSIQEFDESVILLTKYIEACLGRH
jgi:hypothetical protein